MSTNGTTTTKKPFQRLPKNVSVKHYRLTLEPDLVNLTFSGSEVVDIEIKEETSKIVLNAVGLQVSGGEFKSSKNEGHSSTNVYISKEEETLTITFEEALKPGAGQLHMTFSGILSERMKGFYRSKYTLNGEERWAAATQFESTFARYAFPCWVII